MPFMTKKGKMVVGFLAIAYLVGMRVADPTSASGLKDHFANSINLGLPGAEKLADPVTQGLSSLALVGSKVPVVGGVTADIVAGTYGILWGWTY